MKAKDGVNDKRYKKSEEKLYQALARLLEHRDSTAITVNELCIEAGITRGTFYRHYDNVSDLFIRAETVIHHDGGVIITAILSREDTKISDLLNSISLFVHRNQDFLRILYAAKRIHLLEVLADEARPFLQEKWRREFGIIDQQTQNKLFYWQVYGYIGLLRYWLKETDGSMNKLVEVTNFFKENMMLETKYPRI